MITPITGSPLAIRVAPYAVFLALTLCQGSFAEGSQYWFYLAKTMAGAGMLWMARPFIQEMRWKWSWEGWTVGVIVFTLWVSLDACYPKLDELGARLGLVPAKDPANLAAAEWNPPAYFGGGTLAWLFIGIRIAGSSLVVPPLEEVFFRSFLYRYLAAKNFTMVPLGRFHLGPFLMGAVVFGLGHNQWLAGILCGLIYQGLVCWKGRLGEVILAHAVTNFLLGFWVVWRGAWHFW